MRLFRCPEFNTNRGGRVPKAIAYLKGPYNAGPKSALFLRVALIKAGVTGAGAIRAVLKREHPVFEKLSYFEIWYIASLA